MTSEAVKDSFDSRTIRPHSMFAEAIDNCLPENLLIIGPWRLDGDLMSYAAVLVTCCPGTLCPGTLWSGTLSPMLPILGTLCPGLYIRGLFDQDSTQPCGKKCS